jgi:hypothetical protein
MLKLLRFATNCSSFIQLGAVKIYVVAVEEALRKKERQDETQFTTKIDGLFFMFF